MADEQHILQCLSTRPHLKKIIERHAHHRTLHELIKANLPPALAKHCISATMQGDALVLHIDQSSIAHPIRLTQHSLLTAICRAFPQQLPTNRLVIKVQHPMPTRVPYTPSPNPYRPLPTGARQLLSQAAAHIKHPALAQAMQRLAKKEHQKQSEK